MHDAPLPSSDVPVDCASIALAYDDALAAIAFLEHAFGFTKRFVVPGPDGSVMHSELSLGTAVVMVSTSNREKGQVSPLGASVVAHTVCIRVKDPDAHFARARAAGATLVRPLRTEEYGARGYQARDPEGHCWYFSDYRPGAYW